MQIRIHNSITPRRIEEAVRSQMFGTENPGFCIKCGADADGCEPDARKYHCDECDSNAVYGAQEVMMMVEG